MERRIVNHKKKRGCPGKQKERIKIQKKREKEGYIGLERDEEYKTIKINLMTDCKRNEQPETPTAKFE